MGSYEYDLGLPSLPINNGLERFCLEAITDEVFSQYPGQNCKIETFYTIIGGK